jgi:hypothetical protein
LNPHPKPSLATAWEHRPLCRRVLLLADPSTLARMPALPIGRTNGDQQICLAKMDARKGSSVGPCLNRWTLRRPRALARIRFTSARGALQAGRNSLRTFHFTGQVEVVFHVENVFGGKKHVIDGVQLQDSSDANLSELRESGESDQS